MNILSFDIEEWFIYEQYPKGGVSYYKPIIDNYLNQLLDKLEEYDIKATFFCLGIIARENPDVIKLILNRGHEIGCHSDKHELITNFTQDSFREDTRIALDSLQQLTGNKVNFYRAPAFSITEKSKWSLEILIDEGITCDSSIFPSIRRIGGFSSFEDSKPVLLDINSKNILEFPINYSNFFGKRIIYSGGGYFRLFPYYLIQYLTDRSDYNMTYFHIRDFDKHQVKIGNKWSKEYFSSYYGINAAFDKFDKYISDFKFISLGEAIKSININTIKKIQL